MSIMVATGKGVSGRVNGREVLLGNKRLLAAFDVSPDELDDKAEKLSSQGKTAMFMAVDGKAAGILSVSDSIKKTTALAQASVASVSEQLRIINNLQQ